MRHAIIDIMQWVEKGMIKFKISQYYHLVLDVEKQANFFSGFLCIFLLLFTYSCVPFLPIPPPHAAKPPSLPYLHPPP